MSIQVDNSQHENLNDLVPVSSGLSDQEMQVVARTVTYVAIGSLVLLSGTFLILFPPAGAIALMGGLGVYYGGIGALAFGPGIFEGSGAMNSAMNRVRDESLRNTPINQSGPSGSNLSQNPTQSSVQESASQGLNASLNQPQLPVLQDPSSSKVSPSISKDKDPISDDFGWMLDEDIESFISDFRKPNEFTSSDKDSHSVPKDEDIEDSEQKFIRELDAVISDFGKTNERSSSNGSLSPDRKDLDPPSADSERKKDSQEVSDVSLGSQEVKIRPSEKRRRRNMKGFSSESKSTKSISSSSLSQNPPVIEAKISFHDQMRSLEIFDEFFPTEEIKDALQKKRSASFRPDAPASSSVVVAISSNSSDLPTVSDQDLHSSKAEILRQELERELLEADPEKDPEYQAIISEAEMIRMTMSDLGLTPDSESKELGQRSDSDRGELPDEQPIIQIPANVTPLLVEVRSNEPDVNPSDSSERIGLDSSSSKDSSDKDESSSSVIPFPEFEKILDDQSEQEDFEVKDLAGLRRALFFLDVDKMPKDVQDFLLNKKRYNDHIGKASEVRAFVKPWLATYDGNAKKGEESNKFVRFGPYLRPKYKEHYKHYLERKAKAAKEKAAPRYLSFLPKSDVSLHTYLKRKPTTQMDKK